MPDDGSCEMKHVARWCVTSECCVGHCMSIVCDIEKHEMYQNKTYFLMFIIFLLVHVGTQRHIPESIMTTDQDMPWGVSDICHVSEEGHIKHL